MIFALILGFLFFFVFPTWIDIQSAGGWDAWMSDTDSWIARILIFISHFAR